MPLELAIRPRLRLRELPPPRPRERSTLPLRVAGYWSAVALTTFGLYHAGAVADFLEPAVVSIAEPARSPLPLGAAPAEPPIEVHEAEPLVASQPQSEVRQALTDFAPEATPLPRRAAIAFNDLELELDDEPRREAGPVEPSRRRPSPAQANEAPLASRTAHVTGQQSSFENDPFMLDTTSSPVREPSVSARELARSILLLPSPIHTGGLPSCEAAIADANEEVVLGQPRGPVDLSREAYASLLEDGRYLTPCGVPASTVVEVCVAVKAGRALGVSVRSLPSSSALNACVKRAVAGLAFPSSARLDVTHTRFEAVAR